MINETFARQCWPGENAVGKRFRNLEADRWLEVAGVVGDVRGPVRIDAPETQLQFYVPLVQAPTRFFNVALRGSVAPETFAPAVRRIVAAIDSDLPVAQPGAVRAQIDRIKQKSGSAFVVLLWEEDGKVPAIVALTPDLVKKGLKAGEIVKQVAAVIGGSGGGKPEMAQAAGKDASKIPDALALAKKLADAGIQ